MHLLGAGFYTVESAVRIASAFAFVAEQSLVLFMNSHLVHAQVFLQECAPRVANVADRILSSGRLDGHRPLGSD
jgi:hypothetical protein